MREEWKKIQGFDVYEVSNLGRVRRKTKNGTKLLNQHIRFGINYVDLRFEDGTKTQRCVRALVAEAFVPNPNNYKSIKHIDNDRFNVCADNLEWYKKEVPKGCHGHIRKTVRMDIAGLVEKVYPKLSDVVEDGYHASGVSIACRTGGVHKGKRWKYEEQ